MKPHGQPVRLLAWADRDMSLTPGKLKKGFAMRMWMASKAATCRLACLGLLLVGCILVTAQADAREGSEDASQAEEKVQHAPPLRIGIDAEGKLSLDGVPTEVMPLYMRLRIAASMKARPIVWLEIAPTTPFRDVVRIIEQCHYEGLDRLYFGLHVKAAKRSGKTHITIARDGSPTINGKKVSANLLSLMMMNTPEGNGDALLEIEAGDDIPYKSIEAVLKIAGLAGVDQVSIRHRQITLAARAWPEEEKKKPIIDLEAHVKEKLKEQKAWHAEASEWAVKNAATMLDLRKEMAALRDTWLKKAKVSAKERDNCLLPSERKVRAAADRDPAKAKLIEAIDIAADIEQDMLTMYREFLAAKTSAERSNLTFTEAYENAVIARPTRDVLNKQVMDMDVTKPLMVGTFRRAYRGELNKATGLSHAMRANMERLVAHAKAYAQTKSEIELMQNESPMIEYRGPELMPDEIDFTHSRADNTLKPLPCRRLDRAPKDADWLYLDTWHILGPLPVDRRRNTLDERFGPETHVDLDDRFIGHKRMMLTWDYTNTGMFQDARADRWAAHWRIEPQRVVTYSIYYAWTEIYSDRDRQVWIATGVDDYGKLWVNDKLIWASPKERKPYNATENVQPIRLHKGHNKVLMRIENAGGTMGFSLLIRQNVDKK